MTATLEVLCFGERAGVLADERGGLSFAYDPAWIAARRPPLSQSLPLDGDPPAAVVHAYFGGLLPEGEPRRLLARCWLRSAAIARARSRSPRRAPRRSAASRRSTGSTTPASPS
jgi:HipA-like protein